MTITEFLLARIDGEEMLARDAASEGSPRRTGWRLWTTKCDTTPCGETLGPRGTVEAHPARVLAECAAKRAIVDARHEDDTCIRILAAVYSDHPDYNKAWRAV